MAKNVNSGIDASTAPNPVSSKRDKETAQHQP
jgi:hypothetical protein